MKQRKIAGAVAVALTLTAGLSVVVPAQAAGDKVVNLITWVNPPAVAVLKQIDAEFEKANPGYTVNYQTTANVTGGYATMQQTAVQGGTADIMGTFPFQPMPFNMSQNNLTPTQLWAVNHVFAPLNGQPWVKSYNSSILASDTYKGKLYGLVTGAYQQGVFYNKTIFAKYKLSPPTTYNQFIHIAQVLSAHHVVPFFDGLQNVGPLYLMFITNPLMQDIWLPKVGDVNTALWTNKAKWTDPAFIKVMERERTIMKYLEPNFTGVPWQAMPGAFANAKAAMLLDGSWDLSSVAQANPKLKMGYFPLPGSNNPKLNQSLLQPDLTFNVLNNSPHKAAALKWLNFFASPKIYAQYVNATGISPSRSSGSYNSVASHALGKWFGQGVSLDKIFPQLPGSGSFYVQPKNWWELQLEMYQGKYTPQQVAKMVQSGWSQIQK